MRLIYEKVSQRSPEEIRLAAAEGLRRHGLVLLGVYELQEMYLKAGVMLRGDLAIFEVADLRSDREILARLPQATAVMPFRFAVYVREGRPRVATVLPRLYLRLLPIPRASWRDLSEALRRIEARLKAALRDLCRRPVGARRTATTAAPMRTPPPNPRRSRGVRQV